MPHPAGQSDRFCSHGQTAVAALHEEPGFRGGAADRDAALTPPVAHQCVRRTDLQVGQPDGSAGKQHTDSGEAGSNPHPTTDSAASPRSTARTGTTKTTGTGTGSATTTGTGSRGTRPKSGGYLVQYPDRQ